MPAAPSARNLAAVMFVLIACVFAQAQESTPPAYLAVVEGTATLLRAGEVQPALRDMPFVTGDRLRTEDGRVEIDFPDGSAIEVGSHSEVEALSPTRVRLIAGTMDHLSRAPARTESATYLPQDLRQYSPTFDENGSWNYDTSYGYVWYPRVGADWRPYYYGTWSSVPAYGWTWVGLDAWSWPTHHYGRWGYARNAWFWIPGRQWGAAWVSWGISTSYVSWCPLGSDGRPVFPLSLGLPGRSWNGWTVMSRDRFGYREASVHRDAIDTRDPRRFDQRTPFVQTTRLPMTVATGGTIGVGVAVGRGTRNPVPRTPNLELRTPNPEPRTPNPEPRTPNPEPRTPNAEPRTPNSRHAPAEPPKSAAPARDAKDGYRPPAAQDRAPAAGTEARGARAAEQPATVERAAPAARAAAGSAPASSGAPPSAATPSGKTQSPPPSKRPR